MPGFDGKGPKGLGPLTGAGLGYCILSLSGSADGRVTGYAGLAGHSLEEAGREAPTLTGGQDRRAGAVSSGRPARPAGARPTRDRPPHRFKGSKRRL
ncbi:MAG: DUF5320 domain-containing protein [Proteobacteria bacterium]|nr:DUF5320 domain-containing protein [Pseudomonadota bacterium]